jgi:translation elongation factor EF-1beta
MSDITITDKLVDKLTEALNKSVKKTNIFEKIEKIQTIAIGFGLYMSFIGIVTMYNCYSINNIKRIINNNNKIEKDYKEKSLFPDEYIDVKELADSIFKYF